MTIKKKEARDLVLDIQKKYPDFNPIETAFSTIKSWIRRNRDFMEAYNDPIHALLVACSQITSQMAQAFFEASIYI